VRKVLFSWMKRKSQFARINKISEQTNQQSVRRSTPISKQLDANIHDLNQKYLDSDDIIFRNLSIGNKINAYVVGIEGMYDRSLLSNQVISPLTSEKTPLNNTNLSSKIESHLLKVSTVSKETVLESAIQSLYKGDILLFVDGLDHAFILNIRAWEKRNIEEPLTEVALRGPREGFIETLQINLSLLRRKLHHPDLKLKQLTLGCVSQTDIIVAYIDGIASPDIVQEVFTRLKKIETDGVLDSGYIEEFIEDHPFSPFPTVSNTEKPDVVAAHLLEGRVAILTDGTPNVLMMPHLLMENIQAPEDYYSRPFIASLFRILRFFGFLVSTLFPAVYVAFLEYNYEIVPSLLILNIIETRQGVPFPVWMEVFLLMLLFEWLREAGIRMPRPLGQAISIVGAIILGEAAVAANLASAPTIIVIAITAITGYLATGLSDVATILRFMYLFAASLFGITGISIVIMALLLHVAALRSFGIPYMSPWFPVSWSGWRDLFVRFPIWMLDKRPTILNPINPTRQGTDLKSKSPEKRREEE